MHEAAEREVALPEGQEAQRQLAENPERSWWWALMFVAALLELDDWMDVLERKRRSTMLKQVFHKMDADCSGTVELQEFYNLRDDDAANDEVRAAAAAAALHPAPHLTTHLHSPPHHHHNRLFS